MRVHLHHEDHWEKSGDSLVHGDAFIDGDHLSAAEFADRVDSTGHAGELTDLLQRANGFFSLIRDRGDEVDIAVDHVRSWPVYYAVTDDVYVSDSAEWVHETGGRRGYDPVAATEYLFTSYVPGKETLSRDVKQLQAGELVTIRADEPDPIVSSDRYFTYTPRERSDYVRPDEMDQVFDDVFDRFLEFVDGRTILLGLSSGYDSRLIALLLYRYGYDDVVTYTTNSASGSSDDTPVARSVARDLDFEHIELPYDHSDFEYFAESEEMREFVEDVGFLSEYPQIHKLIEHRKFSDHGISPDDVVHTVGHHALGGSSLLPRCDGVSDTVERREFLDVLWRFHYSNWNESNGSRWRRLFEGRILDRLPHDLYQNGDVESVPDALRGIEQWYWQERMPKYLSAHREYGHLGYGVWNPLVDRELYSYLGDTNHRQRVHKRVLKEYVRDLDEEFRGGDALGLDDDESGSSLKDLLWRKSVGTVHRLPRPAEAKITAAFRSHHIQNAYGDDERYGIVPEEKFTSIDFQEVHYRPLLLLCLYENGFFQLPGENELDRALAGR